MATVTDLSFLDGDLVVTEVAPGVFDLAEVTDNEAIHQNAALGIQLQRTWNQYMPEAGWDRMRYLKGAMTFDDIFAICSDVRALLEGIDFVLEATVVFAGSRSLGSQTEFVFVAEATTELGPLVLPFALGGTARV